MRFKAYLKESIYKNSPFVGITKIDKEDEVYDLIRSKCSDAIQHEFPFVIRGFDLSNTKDAIQYRIVKPSSFDRKSANTSNEYNLLLSNLPDWKKFPRRDKSLICATYASESYVSRFGDVNIVIPFNGAKFGVCPAYDLWDSFNEVKKTYSQFGKELNMHIFNESIRTLIAKAGFDLPERNTDYSILLRGLDLATKFLQRPTAKGKLNSEFINTFRDIMEGKTTLYNFLERVLNPNINGFKISTYGGLKEIKNKKQEVWTDSDALLIGFSRYDDTKYLPMYRKIRKKVLSK